MLRIDTGYAAFILLRLHGENARANVQGMADRSHRVPAALHNRLPRQRLVQPWADAVDEQRQEPGLAIAFRERSKTKPRLLIRSY
jgi:hypothetical protein